jgi:hypothetical protein
MTLSLGFPQGEGCNKKCIILKIVLILFLAAFCCVQEVNFMRLNCGDTCPKSGNYKVIDSNGNVINSIHVGEGETMPPTQYSDCHYESEN